MRFNPPPNWPPAPPGWQLWVEDRPARGKAALIIGALVATLLIVVGVVVAIVVTRPTPDVTVKPAMPTQTEQTDEQQIEAVVEKFQSAWNERDFAAFEPIV